MITIYKPNADGHPGCSFRELLDWWEHAGLCKIDEHDGYGVWIGDDILLYDYTTLHQLRCNIKSKFKIALFGNSVHHDKNCYPWIFWPKSTRHMGPAFHKAGQLKYDDRYYESIWIGSATCMSRHDVYRIMHKLSFFCQLRTPHNMAYIFNMTHYLDKIMHSRFSLCLPGVGPKCLRDIECMGCGTVPIFTDYASANYYDTLQKDIHYLYAENIENVPDIVSECDQEKWEYMSNNCRDWFVRNSSVYGSFNTTMEIIRKHELHHQVQLI